MSANDLEVDQVLGSGTLEHLTVPAGVGVQFLRYLLFKWNSGDRHRLDTGEFQKRRAKDLIRDLGEGISKADVYDELVKKPSRQPGVETVPHSRCQPTRPDIVGLFEGIEHPELKEVIKGKVQRLQQICRCFLSIIDSTQVQVTCRPRMLTKSQDENKSPLGHPSIGSHGYEPRQQAIKGNFFA